MKINRERGEDRLLLGSIILVCLLVIGIAAKFPVVDLFLQTDADGGGHSFTNLTSVQSTNFYGTNVTGPSVRIASEVGLSAEATLTLDRTSGTGFFEFLSSLTSYPVFMRLFGTNVSDSSTPGGAAMLMLNWTLQQSGAMGYTVLRLIANEETVGSGNKWMIASGPADPIPTFTVDVDGNVYAAGDFTSGVYTNGLASNMVFVDRNGSDASGQRGRSDKPFFTIDAAISNLVSGDTLVIRPGEHTVNRIGPPLPNAGTYESWDNANFIFKSLTNVTVHGWGAVLNTFELVPGQILGNVFSIADCENIRIEGLTFRGLGMDAVIDDQICGEIVIWGTNSNITIQDCTFIDYPNHGVLISQNEKTAGPLVRGCKFIRGGTSQHTVLNVDGAGVAGVGWGSQVVDNYFENVVRGIELEGSGDIGLGQTIISGNLMTNVWNLGIMCLNTSADDALMTDVLISGNTIFMDNTLRPDVPSQHGIVVTGGRRYSITDNIVRGAYHHGIFVSSSHWRINDALIQGNLVSECGRNIAVIESALQITNVTVQGNMALDPTGTNIVVDGKYTKVLNNSVRGANGAGIHVQDALDAAATLFPYIAGNWISGHEPAIQIDSGVLNATVFGNSAIGASTQLADSGTSTVKGMPFTDLAVVGAGDGSFTTLSVGAVDDVELELSEKAPADILDNSSIGNLGQAGTNNLVQGFRNLFLTSTAKRSIEWQEGGAVSWDFETHSQKNLLATDDVSITVANTPTDTNHSEAFLWRIVNPSGDDARSIAWPAGTTNKTRVELTSLPAGYTAWGTLEWDGDSLVYEAITFQTDPQTVTFGGSGRPSLTAGAVLVGKGTDPVDLKIPAHGVAAGTNNNLIGWDVWISDVDHANDDVTTLWEHPIDPTNSVQAVSEVQSTGGPDGLSTHVVRGGYWRNDNGGLAHAYTNQTTYGNGGGTAYFTTNGNSLALVVKGAASANWRTRAGINFETMINPSATEVIGDPLWVLEMNDNPPGGSLVDASGNGHTFVLAETADWVSFTPGKIDTCLTNSNSSRNYTNHNPVLRYSGGPFTAWTWIAPNSTGGTVYWIGEYNVANDERVWSLRGATGVPQLIVSTNGLLTGTVTVSSSGGALTLQAWHLVICQYTGSAIRISVDGSAWDEVAVAEPLFAGATQMAPVFINGRTETVGGAVVASTSTVGLIDQTGYLQSAPSLELLLEKIWVGGAGQPYASW